MQGGGIHAPLSEEVDQGSGAGRKGFGEAGAEAPFDALITGASAESQTS